MGKRGHYGFEKRQKEIKRKKKLEEKLERRRVKKEGGESGPPIVELDADGQPLPIEVPEVEEEEVDAAEAGEPAPSKDG